MSIENVPPKLEVNDRANWVVRVAIVASAVALGLLWETNRLRSELRKMQQVAANYRDELRNVQQVAANYRDELSAARTEFAAACALLTQLNARIQDQELARTRSAAQFHKLDSAAADELYRSQLEAQVEALNQIILMHNARVQIWNAKYEAMNKFLDETLAQSKQTSRRESKDPQ